MKRPESLILGIAGLAFFYHFSKLGEVFTAFLLLIGGFSSILAFNWYIENLWMVSVGIGSLIYFIGIFSESVFFPILLAIGLLWIIDGVSMSKKKSDDLFNPFNLSISFLIFFGFARFISKTLPREASLKISLTFTLIWMITMVIFFYPRKELVEEI
ncbi:MAG: hypothetical protein ACE5K4_00910 [Candidatus Hydrothermarchaeota archaeon]